MKMLQDVINGRRADGRKDAHGKAGEGYIAGEQVGVVVVDDDDDDDDISDDSGDGNHNDDDIVWRLYSTGEWTRC